MLGPEVIRIKNFQRQQQINKNKDKRCHWITPPKSQVKKTLKFQVKKKCKKFGYDFEFTESITLKNMKEQFLYKSLKYLGQTPKTKVLKNKDKYERNEKLGKVFKKNPLIRIFEKLELKIIHSNKFLGFKALKQFS